MAIFIWLIIRLIQLVFSAGTVFFSHKKSANSVFQPAYNSSRTAPIGRFSYCLLSENLLTLTKEFRNSKRTRNSVATVEPEIFFFFLSNTAQHGAELI
jgi:hypothetical protein